MRFMLKETRLGLRNSTTRIPFRYGAACLTRCPQAVLNATIDIDGKSHVAHMDGMVELAAGRAKPEGDE